MQSFASKSVPTRQYFGMYLLSSPASTGRQLNIWQLHNP